MKALPRYPLAHLPTPLEPLSRLSAELGGPELWVKRDDQTGLAFGGNKARKLEYLVADALAQGADFLLTAGALQSNHCRQTAAAAARLGMGCKLILVGEPPQQPSANLLLDRLLGAEITWVAKAQRDPTLQAAYKQVQSEGRKPYPVPYGGSSPLGAAAYAYALAELLAQDAGFDALIFATSSGGTQAGLLAGARIQNYPGRVVGISVDEPAGVLKPRIAELASRTIQLLGGDGQIEADEVLVNDRYIGEGYARLGSAELAAIRRFARLEGLLLDPVYTGRAAAGLLDLLAKGFFRKGERLLFWHTGGTPALFADVYAASLITSS